jgi:serine/threonine protein kinase
LIQKELNDGGLGFVYVANDPDANLEIVLKLIVLGSKNSKSRNDNKKLIEKELNLGLTISKECKYLISYSETFEWGDYFCIKMEYCNGGDLQSALDEGRIFTEEV